MLLTFDAWMDIVDEICQTRCGVSIYDLPDCPFRDWYDDGMTPSTAVSRASRAQC